MSYWETGFLDERLSERVARHFKGAPAWNTSVTPRKNGFKDFNAEWEYPLHRYVADYNLMTLEEREEFLSAVWVAQGMWGAFPFKDHNDFKATDVLLGVGAGTTAAMQLVKRYTRGTVEIVEKVRPIKLPVVSTVHVFQAGVERAVTVDRLTGLVVPAVAWTPGVQIRATFEFDVRVHFASDYTALSRPGGQVSKVNVELEEVRE